MLTPFLFDLEVVSGRVPAAPAVIRSAPRVSFVTSLFKGGDFLPGYLENVTLAAREADGEVIVIDANGDDADARVVRQFMETNREGARLVDFVQLDHDPGLYNCWRIAIERSRAPLITNANLDDRRGPWHTAHLVGVLAAHEEFAGACSSISCVTSHGESQWYRLTDNQLWFHGEGSRPIGFTDLFVEDADGDVRSRCVPHCMPVWRKRLHDTYGFFDEKRYGTSADWAFWLKCTKAGEQFFFDEKPFGRYYMNTASHNRRNDIDGRKELRIIEDLLGRVQSRITKQ